MTRLLSVAVSVATPPKMHEKAQRFQHWRAKIHTHQLASQISSILLERHNWSHLLKSLNLSNKLTPSLFLSVLRRTQANPNISLRFFRWTKAHLGFEPDLKSHSQLLKVSLVSGLSESAEPILDHLVQNYSSSAVVDSVVWACKGSDSQSQCLSSVLQTYGKKGLFSEGLEVFDKMRARGFSPSVGSCNEMLDALQRENEVRLAWCFLGAVVRNGVAPNPTTWSIIARVLGKSDKPERVARILEMGVYSSEMYGILVDCLSKSGSFESAFDRLNEMRDRRLDPGFSTYSSILDGACRHEDREVIARTKEIMAEKGLISNGPLREYDELIEKLCGLSRTFAAEMFFRIATDEKIGLKDTTFGHMLSALSTDGRVDGAIWMYRLISEKGVALDDNTLRAFARVLLKEERCEEQSDLLIEIIREGFIPSASDLSRFVAVLCAKGKWIEAEDILNLILGKALLPDSFCCSALVERCCSVGRIDSAVALHDKMEKLGISLDVMTYDALVEGLVAASRVEEAAKVFDYMRRHAKLSSESFVAMIRGLCGVNELRKAMKLHDEMLKLGLKPDQTTYKSLILVFK